MTNSNQPKDLLEWLTFRKQLDYAAVRFLGPIFAIFLIVASFLLFFGAITASVLLLFQTIFVEASAAATTGLATLLVALIGGPFLIWRTFIAHRALGYQKEGHITDRISRAVEQLGAEKTVKRRERLDTEQPQTVEESEPNIEVRIGAILSLERIAQDSVNFDNGRDHVRIMEILCAYIRHNAPKSLSKSFEGYTRPTQFDLAIKKDAFSTYLKVRYGSSVQRGAIYDFVQKLDQPRLDIQIALAVIGRRTSKQIANENNWNSECAPPIDFQQHNALMYPNSELDLTRYAQKPRAYRLQLTEVNLQGAKFEHHDLSSIDFKASKLDGANFFGCNLSDTSLVGCSAIGTKFNHCQLDATNLSHTTLEGAEFIHCYAPNSYWYDCILDGAVMQACNLVKVAFAPRTAYFLRIIKSDFAAASLHFNKQSSILWVAVDLTKSPYSPRQLEQCFGDNETTIEDDSHRPAHWQKFGEFQTLSQTYEQWRVWQDEAFLRSLS